MYENKKYSVPYMRTKTGRNVNCGYAAIFGGSHTSSPVFASIRDAEKYCAIYDLDPDSYIKTDDAQVLSECKEIENILTPVIEMLIDEIKAVYQEQFEEFKAALKERSEAVGGRSNPFNAYCYERVEKLSGVLDGMRLAAEVLETYKKDLFKIRYRK